MEQSRFNKMNTYHRLRRKALGVEQLNVEIPADLHRGLKILAAIDCQTFKQVTLTALSEFYESRRSSLPTPSLLPRLTPTKVSPKIKAGGRGARGAH